MHPFSVEDAPSCLDPTDIGVGIAEAGKVSEDPIDIESGSGGTAPQPNRWNGLSAESEVGHSGTRRGSFANTRPSASLFLVEQLTKARSSSEKEEYKLMEIARLIISRRLVSFAYDSSVVGLVNLVRPSPYAVCSVLRKIVWVILLLFGVVVMGIQIQGRIDYYMAKPTTVKYQLVSSTSLRFPTVTICMENRLRRRVVEGFGQ